MAWSEQRSGDVKTVHVFTTAIDNGSWTAITIPSGVNCNTALCKCRTSTNVWKLASLSGGSPYITFEAAGSLAVDIVQDASVTLFYVQGTDANDTFEVILGRKI